MFVTDHDSSYRPQEHDVEDEPWDPITGSASAIIGTMSSMAMGVADMPIVTLKALKIHPDAARNAAAKLAPAGSVGRDAGEPRRSSVTRLLSPRNSRSRSRVNSIGDDSDGQHSSPSTMPDAAIARGTVSYTHLTLPTIYSV